MGTEWDSGEDSKRFDQKARLICLSGVLLQIQLSMGVLFLAIVTQKLWKCFKLSAKYGS